MQVARLGVGSGSEWGWRRDSTGSHSAGPFMFTWSLVVFPQQPAGLRPPSHSASIPAPVGDQPHYSPGPFHVSRRLEEQISQSKLPFIDPQVDSPSVLSHQAHFPPACLSVRLHVCVCLHKVQRDCLYCTSRAWMCLRFMARGRFSPSVLCVGSSLGWDSLARLRLFIAVAGCLRGA